MMKKRLRLIIRGIIGSQEHETIRDSIIRKNKNFKKKFINNYANINDLRECLNEMGIQEGDCLFVHSSFRSFYGFKNVSPKIIINLLEEIVGPEGTILMPSYGENKAFIDLKHSKSMAGIISDEFLKQPGVQRSIDSYFSISVKSKDNEKFIGNHRMSNNPFDEASPFQSALDSDGKILALGIGKFPYKISFVHYVTYGLSKSDYFYNTIYSRNLDCEIIDYEGKKIKKSILVRKNGFPNYNKNIKLLTKKVKHKNKKISSLDVYTCKIVDFVETAKEMNSMGYRFYEKK